MAAVEDDAFVELKHKSKPWPGGESYQRADGLWVYRKLRARELWDQIMRSTYDHAEPGILFLDRMNRDKQPGTTARRSKRPIPAPSSRCRPMAAAAWGSIDLTRFIKNPFSEKSAFDFAHPSPKWWMYRSGCSTTCWK